VLPIVVVVRVVVVVVVVVDDGDVNVVEVVTVCTRFELTLMMLLS